MMTEMLFRREGRIGIATLNRPAALNALNRAMCRAWHAQLNLWAFDDSVAAIVIEGAGDRAFCAGGDVVGLAQSGRGPGREWQDFFADEYRMNQAIHACPKPHIALLDGVTMGGGVGLSIHGPIRIASERTLFAMPETGIGLIPDVGGTHALARLPGEIGTWLGLTGARLKAADCRYAGIATHHVPAAQMPLLIDRLAHADVPVATVIATLDTAAADIAGHPPLAALRDGIDYHFAHDTVAAILASLDSGDAWALQTAATIRRMSPTSLMLALYGIRAAAGDSLESCLIREYRMVCAIRGGDDFYEGIRAQLIDKDRNPRWNPAALADVDITAFLQPPPWGDLRFD
jgi:enoyl-CoA hydratase